MSIVLRMDEKSFQSKLDALLEENQRLSQGGVPDKFGIFASLVAEKSVLILTLLSFSMTIGMILIFQEKIIALTETFLLIW